MCKTNQTGAARGVPSWLDAEIARLVAGLAWRKHFDIRTRPAAKIMRMLHVKG